MSCLIFFCNNSLGFQCVQPSKLMDSAFQVSPVMKVIVAHGDVTDILKLFSNHVCYNTQTMPKFQVMNFHYVILLTPRFLKWPECFWKICVPQP